MLSVVNSGKFTLTLQSTPPFVIESIFALALAVLLAVPLITNLQFYLVCTYRAALRIFPSLTGNKHGEDSKEESSKRKRNIRNCTIADVPSDESNGLNNNHKDTSRNENSSERIRRAVVMHYPTPISIDTSSSSDLDPRVGTLSRRSVSTPNVRSNCDGDGWFQNENYKTTIKRNNEQRVNHFVRKIKSRKDALLDGSSSFVATNSELPIIDISTFNYNSYRHKLIEASLKKRYRESQPPGDVIFNSIHLNTTDSTLGIRLNEEYDHSFFDFVEEYYDATAGMSRKEMEFLHPLDHFLVRDRRKRETSEKATETMSRTGNQTDQRETVVDNKPIERHALDKNGNISKARGKNFSGISNKPENESSRSMDSRKNFEEKEGVFASGLVDSNSIGTRVATALCIDRAETEKSPGRKSSSETSNLRKPACSIVKAGKDSINVSSSSSGELGSAYSETEKQQRNATSNHSRDSSVSPTRGRTAARKLLPWITGNPSVSFNRKYGNKCPEISDRSTKRKVRSSERPSTSFHSRPASPRPRSANLSMPSRKTNYQNSSELGETVKGIGNYTASKEKLMRSNKPEISSSTLATPSRISSRPLSKLFVPLKNNSYRRFENVVNRSYAKFKEKRDRAGEMKFMKITSEEDQEKITPGINYRDQVMDTLHFERFNFDDQSNKTEVSYADERTHFKSTAERFESVINKAESWKESASCRRNNKGKPRNDIFPKKETRRKLRAGLNNLGKTRELSRGNKSDRCSRDKTDCSRSVIESWDPLALVTSESRSEKESFDNQSLPKENDEITKAKNLAIEKNMKEELKLPGGDSKVGLAMRTSLKNYIKTLKQILKNGGNVDMVDLASLSLKDAISPELESILSSSELKELQDLLNIAEIKSNLTVKDVLVV